MVNEVEIVKAVKAAVAERTAGALDSLVVSIDGTPMFEVTPQLLRCTRCSCPLVPQYVNGMDRWTRAKINYVRVHASCAGRQR